MAPSTPLTWLIVLWILPEAFFLYVVWRNERFARDKARRRRTAVEPVSVALIVPCRGLDTGFEENIAAFYRQTHQPTDLVFVVENPQDPAYAVLSRLRDQWAGRSSVRRVEILCAGPAQGNSQKVHNLLAAVRHLDHRCEILAFADADVRWPPDGLVNLVHPLSNPKHGASSGYRWFVPQTPRAAGMVLSAINARVAQLLGNTRFNHVWGGAMAIRDEFFHAVGLDRTWRHCLSDDYTLSHAVKAAGKKVAYVPVCLSPSPLDVTASEAWEFLRRQLIITRVCARGSWWFALGALVYTCGGWWASVLASLWADVSAPIRLRLVLWAAAITVCQAGRAVLRQRIARSLPADWRDRLRTTAWVDVLLFPLIGGVFLAAVLASAGRRTIRWRGIPYRLLSPTRAERLDIPGETAQAN